MKREKWVLLWQRRQELGWEETLEPFNPKKTPGFGGFYPLRRVLTGILETTDGLAGAGAAWAGNKTPKGKTDKKTQS